ncbi:MAG: tetratricopeptide repeat protein [Planctomycetota bacterium]
MKTTTKDLLSVLLPAGVSARARLARFAVTGVACLVLAGCGGGGGSSDATFDDGVALQEDAEWAEAIAVYDAVLADDPEHLGALFNRGVAKLESADASGAVADFDGVLALAPDDLDAVLWRGAAYLEQGQAGKALADFDVVIDASPFAPEAYALRAQAHHDAGDYALALADLDAAVRLEPDDPAYFEGRADMFEAMQEPGAAEVERSLAAVTAQLVAQPDDPIARTRRGVAFLVLDEPELALADLSIAIEAQPENLAARLARGQCLVVLDEHGGALEDFALVAEDREADPAIVAQARLGLASVFESRGAFADAAGEYETLRAGLNPAGILATARLARLRAGCPEGAQRRPALALELAREALSRFDADLAAQAETPAADEGGEAGGEAAAAADTVDPNERWFYLDTLAAALVADGQLAEGIATQRQAVEAAPEDDRADLQARLAAYRDAQSE